MVRVSNRKRLSSRLAFVVALLAFAALLAACAAPTGSGAQSSGAQPAPQAAAPTEAPKQSAAQAAPATAAPTAAQAAPAAGVSYSKDVMPVFEKSCIKCHGGPDGTKGGLNMSTYDDLMKGGEDGAVIVPGNASGSLLVKQIQSGKMPKRASKLPQDQIDLIAKWVTEGANNN